MSATEIQYRRGMPYGQFLKMMEQRRAAGNSTTCECTHPFDAITRDVRGKRRAAGVVIVVEYTCTDCGTQLGRDVQGFKL